jgi:DNA invertase Pin-like site-specific DNA recombinase
VLLVKPVAVYLRVSSDDQSHASQRLAVERWLALQGIAPNKVAWYQDTESGRRNDRKALDRLRADVAAGGRKIVVVYALDRLSRDFFDGLAQLGVWLRAGVRVASATEPIDLAGELGLAVAGVIFALSAAEWRKRRERQTLGIELAKAAGVYTGRKPGALKGGDSKGPGRAVELRAKGLKMAEIATALGVSVSTVGRYLATAPVPAVP